MIYNARALNDLPTRVYCPRCCKTSGYVIHFTLRGLWTRPSVLFCSHCHTILLRDFDGMPSLFDCSTRDGQ